MYLLGLYIQNNDIQLTRVRDHCLSKNLCLDNWCYLRETFSQHSKHYAIHF